MKTKYKKQHRIIFVLCSALFGILLSAAVRTDTFAYDDVTDVVITVGYWGDTKYEKADIFLETMESELPIHQEIYTWINSKPGCGTTAAEGVYLSDLLDYADINMEAVQSYNFFTMDGSGYAQIEKQWTNEDLFGDRYTFLSCFRRAIEECPDREDEDAWTDYIANPQNYFRISNFFSNGSYLSTAWQEREEIEPMLALRINSVNWDTYPPEEDPFDFSRTVTTGMPELLFGQSTLDEKSRQYMAQMVCRIHIWYGGSPTIVSDTASLEGETGDTVQIGLQVTTPDDYLTQMVRQNITWTSDDESVATVDSYGNVTFVGEGEATVYASYGSIASVSVPVSAAEKTDDEGSGGDSGDESGNSGGTTDDGSGKGNTGSAEENGGSGTGAATGTGDDKNVFNVRGAGSEKNTDKNTVTVLDKDAGKTVNTDVQSSSGSDADAGNGSRQAVTEENAYTDGEKMRIYQISEYIEELTEEEPEQVNLLGGGLLCILAGILAESLRFRYQTCRRRNI